MKFILAHLLTPIFYFLFGLILVVFHPIQVLAYQLFGRTAHQKVVYVLNYCLVNALRVLGTSIKVKDKHKIPKDKPLIVLANHSSLHDITGIYGLLSQLKPVFVSKKSLSKGIPSVSYNLRKSGAAIIDRKDRSQSINEIMKLGAFINENNFAAVIFPEGTRSNELTRFKLGGFEALIKKAPNAIILPIAIKGTGDLYMNKKAYPLNVFKKISWTVLDPIYREGQSNEDILNQAHRMIGESLSEK
ncbi:MAG: 1-acyl-sn-glycerol-3-phosphate acyltransferase [Saprospiraceae bacterium]|nr:1-acyl-sn-glycerol-3-phosphate acyltransferase [Bacteroidia bacterium]NNE16421.1 1-acyl-sn-glycerol-3-phosphate acyltransferase [Saprospiraceae bacterium]NNL92613.1 1-acyl-sn-glycerol-3-phosphate acyltransferase [Saprospiraceae bacterium]